MESIGLYIHIPFCRQKCLYCDFPSWAGREGQMQMYVNYYDRYEKIEGENPTIGILLCKQSDEALVGLTLPENANIYAKEYKLYLPDKKLLQKKLKEWLDEEQN